MKPSTRKQLEADGFWEQRCIHSGAHGVQAEHALFYGRNHICEPWAIVPTAPEFNYNPSKETKEKSAYVAMLQCKAMGLWEDVKARYPKKNWDEEFSLLEEKYGEWEFYSTNILNQ